MAKTRLIDMKTVEELISAHEVNEIVEKTFSGFGNRTVLNPQKVTLDLGDNTDWPPYDGYMNAMPAYIGDSDVAGLKWVGGFDGERAEAGLPYINGLILLLDPHLGTFKAVLDGTHITNLRTGAQPAVAIKHMGHKIGSDISLGLFGTGVQAKTSLTAINEWFNITEVKLWNHSEGSVQQFLDAMEGSIDCPITFNPDAAFASDADVIVTATKAKEPIVLTENVSKGTLVIPLGSSTEIDTQLIDTADHIVVDHIGQALHRGALSKAYEEEVIDENDIDATIGALASGRTGLPTSFEEGINICVPIGMGAHDIAIAGEVTNRAEEKELGQIFEFNPF